MLFSHLLYIFAPDRQGKIGSSHVGNGERTELEGDLDYVEQNQKGKIVTPPVFWSITAVSKNLYLCKYDTSSEHGILLNERGERVTVGR